MSEEYQYTDMELLFCSYYVKTANGTQSAINAGYSEKTAQTAASNMLKKEKIQAQINNLRLEAEGSIRAYFLSEAVSALQTLKDLKDDPDAPAMVRYNAAVQFLDRAGFKPPEKQEIESNQNIKVEFNIPRPPKKE